MKKRNKPILFGSLLLTVLLSGLLLAHNAGRSQNSKSGKQSSRPSASRPSARKTGTRRNEKPKKVDPSAARSNKDSEKETEKVIAKDKLNQGAIQYNQGNMKQAQGFFKDATEIDPTNPITWLYLGATMIRDYKTEIDDTKKKEIANQALEVFKKALSLSANNCIATDRALSYIATIHDDLKNVEEWRKTMEDRATNRCTKKEAQAQSYYSIGVNYWKCSYDQTTRYQDKAAKDPFHYRSFEARADFAAEAQADKRKAEACVVKGLENLEKAIRIDPEYVDAMFYKGLLYRERQKLTKEEAKRKELDQMTVKIASDASALQRQKEAASSPRARP